MPPPPPQFAETPFGEADQDDAAGMGNAAAQLKIGTGAGVSDVEAGVGNMDNEQGNNDFGMEQQGLGQRLRPLVLGRQGMGQQGVGQGGMGQGMGPLWLGPLWLGQGLGQQGLGQTGMGQPGVGKRGLGEVTGPQWLGPLVMGQGMGQPGMGLQVLGQRAGMGQASSSEVALQPRFNLLGCSPLPFNYRAGLGGGAARRPLSFAAAAPQGAAAPAPQGAATAVDYDAWLRKVVPPNSLIDTINYIGGKEHLTSSIPIEEIFDFAKLVRWEYREIFVPGRKQPSPMSLKRNSVTPAFASSSWTILLFQHILDPSQRICCLSQ